jgi:hypothetical protein
MGLAVYVAHMKFWLESLQGRCHLQDLFVDRIILKLILGKQVWRVWIEFIWRLVMDRLRRVMITIMNLLVP